ncbi:MAG TPA: hypothetical protein PLP48_03060, partial [Acholeplasmataceae bacterium]|nr:hypothetical protein [Acholeplasmataceae bacterium]
LFVAFATSFTTQAAEGDLIDLYPYDQVACLEATNACTQTKLGDSFWDMEYAGHRYHFVRGAVRFASKFIDGNADGLYGAGEMGGLLSWNAFAALTINNTDEEVVLTTINGRADLTSVVHRIYSYFDAEGQLQMFEDQILTYYIFNEGTVAAPDWRLATPEEKAAYDAAPAESKPVTTRNTHIRMKLDSSDSDGYKLEPIKYTKWIYADVEDTAPIEDRSLIITGNPDLVTIPAGWSVVSFGTNDRGTLNAKTTSFIKTFPTLMIDSTVEPMEAFYINQAPTFGDQLGANDDDAATPGINFVIDFNGEVELPNTVVATYLDMYDVDGNIINTVRKVDYQVIFDLDGVVLETITFTYNSSTDTYSASGEVTQVDTSVFGAVYSATYRAINPEDSTLIKDIHVDIIIGVLPPKYVGVANRYIDEKTFVNLMEGISADDGYGNDITDLIELTVPENLNVYSPEPGVYEIDLRFVFNVFIEGVDPNIVLNGTSYPFTGTMNTLETNFASKTVVYTDVTNFKLSTFSWSSAGVIIEVGGDGKIIRTINRRTWDLVDENGLNTPANASGMFDAWKTNLTLEENGFIIVVGVNMGTAYTAAQALLYDQVVSYDAVGIPDVDEDFIKTSTYTLTVDDITAPMALIVNDNYQIVEGQYANVNQAILANIVAFDNFDAIDDLAIYVSNNGGLNVNTPGSYDVEVTVEDAAGNATVVTFEVTVLNDDKADDIADLLAQLEDAEQALADLEDQFGDDEAALAAAIARIAALEAALEAAEEAIEALQVVPETGCGSAINGSSALFITLSILMGAALIVFLKKRS